MQPYGSDRGSPKNVCKTYRETGRDRRWGAVLRAALRAQKKAKRALTRSAIRAWMEEDQD